MKHSERIRTTGKTVIDSGEEKVLYTGKEYRDMHVEATHLEEMLNELIDCHYGVATHHIGDGDGIPNEMAEKIRVYWTDHLKE